MIKLLKPATILSALYSQRKLQGQDLLNAFRALPRLSSVKLSPGYDDSNDVFPVALMLTETQRKRWKISIPISLPAPPPSPGPTPVYVVRVQAILCANDDGSGGASSAGALDAHYLKSVIDATNIIYQNTGIQFKYDPVSDFVKMNSTLLNLDFVVPSGLDYNRPKDKPPLTDAEIAALSKPHTAERQRVGGSYRHKMVLMFCDGNEIVFDETQGKWVVTPRSFAFSWNDLEFVALPTGKGDVAGFANLIGHETGHYFHQVHTHNESPATVSDAAKKIREKVEDKTFTKSNGLQVFNGDGLADTPPDAGNNIFHNTYGSWGCSVEDTVTIPVIFSDGTKKEYYLRPDRGNVMSYFKHCMNFSMHFSPMQIAGMRRSMEEKNRWHLIHPSMRLHAFGAFELNSQVSFYGVWKPSEEPEIQVYDWPYADVRKKYDELWPQGWRLKLLSPYVVGGQVRYAVAWKPGKEGEIQVYDWLYADVRKKYDELWPQGWRLKLLSPYVVGGQVRYAAVWKPGTEGEIQVYDWPYADVRKKYDELWPQGWRLKLLAPFVLNGQVRYAAVWKPSTEDEIQVYDWLYADVRKKYDELWPQGWRLKLLSPYVLNGQVRYAAVWKRGTEGEIQVYGWPYSDFRNMYDRMW